MLTSADSSASRAGTIDFDFRELSARDRNKLMIGAIVPRPIALVTTVDPPGRVNAAPFSFFNCLSHDPLSPCWIVWNGADEAASRCFCAAACGDGRGP